LFAGFGLTAMALPETLADLLSVAAQEVGRDPYGALTVQRRHEIVLALGPHKKHGRGVFRGPGLRRRVALVASCVRYALPLWEAKLPEDDTPHRLLSAAEANLVKRKPRERMKHLIWEGWSHGDVVSCEFADRHDEGGLMVALLVHAASRVAWVALRDEMYTLLIDPAAGGWEYGASDPESTDAAFTVSVVVSGGWPNRTGLGGKDLRRQYWRWYLRRAVPAAFESVP
jgi:hypothetical protein